MTKKSRDTGKPGRETPTEARAERRGARMVDRFDRRGLAQEAWYWGGEAA